METKYKRIPLAVDALFATEGSFQPKKIEEEIWISSTPETESALSRPVLEKSGEVAVWDDEVFENYEDLCTEEESE